MRSLESVLDKYIEDNGLADVKVCPLCGYVGSFEKSGHEGAGHGICPECGSDGLSRMFGLQMEEVGVGRGISQILCLDPSSSIRSMLERMPYVDAQYVGTEDAEDTGKPDGAFQAIVCNGAAGTSWFGSGALSEFRRILAEGGVLIASVHRDGSGDAGGEWASAMDSSGFSVEVRTAVDICDGYMCTVMDVNPEDLVVVAKSMGQIRTPRGAPLVSVIMPVYNASEFLRQTLDSVVGQTLRDIEVICVNDGSTDDSADIIREYASRDPRVKLVEQSNGGAGKARNNGITYATGDYVHYMDSDDWLDLNAYERITGKMEATGVDVCIFQAYTLDFETEQLRLKVRTFRTDDYISNIDDNPNHFIRNFVVPWDKLIRREVVVGNGLRYDEISCANDRSFYFGLIKHAKEIMVCKDRLIYHRVNNPGSLVGDNRSVNYDAHFTAYESTMAHHADADDSVKRLLVDMCMGDMLGFYRRAREDYQPRIYQQLHDFLQTVDFSLFTSSNGYHWWEPFMQIRDNPDFPEPSPEDACEALREATAERATIGEAPVREDVIVSLTSYPARIGSVHTVVQSLLRQTVRAGRIILWLSEEQFPGREDDLPEELLALRPDGLEIRFCEDDLKPHKKYFYAMREFPDSAIVTVDDDMEYSEDTIEKLVESYGLFPNAVSAMRVLRIPIVDGRIGPYSEWDNKDNTFYRNPSMQAMATGVSGVLYPPGVIPEAAFNPDAIKETCLFGDDLWLKFHEVDNGVPVVLAAPLRDLEFLEGTQEGAIWFENKVGGMNDRQIQCIQEWFSLRTGTDLTEKIRAGQLDAGIRVSFLWDCYGKDCGRAREFLGCMPDWGELVCYNVSGDEDLQSLRGMWWDRRLTILSVKDVRTPLFAAAECCRGIRTVAVDPSLFKYETSFFEEASKAAERAGRIVADVPEISALLKSKRRKGGAFDPYCTVIDKEVLTGGKFAHIADGMSTFAVASYAGLEIPADSVHQHIEPRLYNDLALRSVASGLASSSADERPLAERTRAIYDALRARPGMSAGESEYGVGMGSVRRRVCPLCGTAAECMLPGGERLWDGVKCPSCGSLERHRTVEIMMRYTLDVASGAPKILYFNYPGRIVTLLRRRGMECAAREDLAKVKGKYDAIVFSHLLQKERDRGTVLDRLRSKLSPRGVLFVTLPLSPVEGRLYMVKETDYDVYEIMEEMRGHGFETSLRWNKDAFSAETIDLYSLRDNAVILCRVSNPSRRLLCLI